VLQRKKKKRRKKNPSYYVKEMKKNETLQLLLKRGRGRTVPFSIEGKDPARSLSYEILKKGGKTWRGKEKEGRGEAKHWSICKGGIRLSSSSPSQNGSEKKKRRVLRRGGVGE